MKVNLKLKNKNIFIKSFIGGLGWMVGATFGFTILLALLEWLGGLPVIGNWIANLIEIINQALETKRGLL